MTSRKYLTDPEAYIQSQISMGYSTCHALNSSLDARVCNKQTNKHTNKQTNKQTKTARSVIFLSQICLKDCQKLGRQQFARDCRGGGGFFKCCIRRDAAFCHECRFSFPVFAMFRLVFPDSAARSRCAPTLPAITPKEENEILSLLERYCWSFEYT